MQRMKCADVRPRSAISRSSSAQNLVATVCVVRLWAPPAASAVDASKRDEVSGDSEAASAVTRSGSRRSAFFASHESFETATSYAAVERSRRPPPACAPAAPFPFSVAARRRRDIEDVAGEVAEDEGLIGEEVVAPRRAEVCGARVGGRDPLEEGGLGAAAELARLVEEGEERGGRAVAEREALARYRRTTPPSPRHAL